MTPEVESRKAPGDGERPLRVLVVSKFYWPAPGGQSAVLRSLARCWAEAGHDVHVLTTRSVPSSAASAREDGASVRRIPVVRANYAEVFWFMGWTFLRVLLGTRPDVVIVSMLKHGAVAALAAAWLRGIPVVLRTEGGGDSGDVAWHETARLGGWIRRVCRRADRIVAISRPILDELGRSGFPASRVRYIPNCVEEPSEPWDPSELDRRRREVGASEGPVVVFTGRLLVAKGLLDLIDATERLHRDGLPVQLWIAGEGRDRPAVERRVAETALAGSVRLLGHVADVPALLRAADVFVLPSHAEGMSISLLEALAFGMPVVASDIPANRQLGLDAWIRFHEVGRPASLADALRDRLSAPVRTKEEIARCRADVSGLYGARSIASRYVEEFRVLAHGGASAVGDRRSRA